MELIPASSAHRQSAHAGILAVQQPRAFNSTLNMCDSLVSFYHQERMWVYRTRASLELVLEAAPTASSDTGLSRTPEPEAPEAKGSGSAMVLRARRAGGVKQEPVDPPNLSSTLWMRRKKSFKLKLEGISTRATKRRRQSPRDASCDQEEPPTPSVQILELFENMMQSRMESCERLSKMVKEAHAAQPNLEGVEI